jgi:hypothetical protein
MFVVAEADAAAIRAVYEQRGEFSAAVGLRRLWWVNFGSRLTTINAVKATGDELHRMHLAVRMIARGRHPSWGAACRIRHVILRISWMRPNLVAGARHLNPKHVVFNSGPSRGPGLHGIGWSHPARLSASRRSASPGERRLSR